MIDLFSVTDDLELFGRDVVLLSRVDFHLPAGRYALLSQTPEFHRPLIDIMAGLRPPREGQVQIAGSISWPIGRIGFVRGRSSGRDVLDLVSSVAGVDRALAEEIVSLIVSRPDYIDQPIERWPPYVKQEFIFAIGLVPDFDVYVIDGAIPFEETRFARLWQALFEERLVGKTLILSTYRQKQMLDYCAKGLIYEANRFRIEDDLERCIESFPARPTREDLGGGGGAAGDGGDSGADFLF